MPHKQERFSEDWTLLQLHRQYGKDEAMKHLFDEISKLKFEIGALKSELSEKEYALVKVNAKKPKQPNDFAKSIRIMQETIYKLSKENEELKNAKIKSTAIAGR